MVNSSDTSEPIVTNFSYGTENRLSSLDTNLGTIMPDFSPDISEYKLIMKNNKTRIRFLPVSMGKVSAIEINGEAVESGILSKSFILDQEENLFRITVTSVAGTTRTYVVTVISEDIDTNPELAVSASVDADKNVKISGNISNGSGKAITALVKNPSGRVNYIGTTYSQAKGYYSFNYKLTDNTSGKYTVEVGAANAKDKVGTQFYYLTDVFLKSLVVSDSNLSPDFKSNVINYTVTVDGSSDYVTLTPVACEGTEKITVNGQVVENGTTNSIRLNKGMSKIKISLEAMGGKLKKTYTITVQKGIKEPKVSARAEIDRNYYVKISGNIGLMSSRIVSVMVTDPKGKVDYTGSTKTAEDGTFETTYKLKNKIKGTYVVTLGTTDLSEPVITKFEYDPLYLSGLSVSVGTLDPAFDKERLSYSANVGNDTIVVTITAIAKYEDVGISIDGGAFIKGRNTSSVYLDVGQNTIPIVVSIGGESKTYSINITRKEMEPVIIPTPEPTPTPEPEESKATLKGISLSEGYLEGEFDPEVIEYSSIVSYDTETIKVKPIASNEKATITVNGEEVASGEWSQEIELETEGETVIEIVVTLGDKSTTYYIYIEKEEAPKDNASLEFIGISAGWYEQEFDPEVTDYSVTVPYSTTYFTVTPYAENENAVIYVNDILVENGVESQEIKLTDGEGTTEIEIVVIAEGETRTYHINVNKRKLATLDILFINPSGWLESDWDPEIFEYDAVVPYGIPSITVIPYAVDETATILVNGKPVNNGEESDEIELNTGDEITEITIAVTVEDKTEIYLLKVKKEKPAILESIEISPGYLESVFEPETFNYSAVVPDGTESIKVTPASSDENTFIYISVNDSDIYSGPPMEQEIEIHEGITQIEIIVVAEGKTSVSYYINVKREE